jgi:transcriptional regulator with XRE-family HTH domain
LESASLDRQLTFELLRSRLLACVKKRVLNGEFSERGLARLLGVSQPQIHNVLKGERTLHVDLADRLLLRLKMSLLDLLDNGEIQRLVNSGLSGSFQVAETLSAFTEDRDSTEPGSKKPMGRARRDLHPGSFEDFKNRVG